jgi:hypothetical protein
MKFQSLIIGLLLTHIGSADVTMLINVAVGGSYKNDLSSPQPDPTIFQVNQAATLKLIYNPTTAPTSITNCIATYHLFGTFELKINSKKWTATQCTIRVGDYLNTATITDMISVNFIATPPAGFTDSAHEISLSYIGKEAPASMSNGNTLPSTVNVLNMNSISSVSLSLSPVITSGQVIPWSVFFSKPSSITITPVP